ncbi:MAG: DUF362 domain-containing protein, partial [Clostridia bacterium]|nr:DUF362 domain-containing protein [Clostridia bacterium]
MENGIPVALTRCSSYSEEEIRRCLVKMFADLALSGKLFAGKRICLKPNLVMAKKPELGATTHPTVLAALAKLLLEQGAKEILIADSPGGPYAAANLEIVYRTCGLTALESIPGVRLNSDFGFRTVTLETGRTLKNCSFLNAVLDC